MFFKCEMMVGGYSYDVSNDLVNWDDVELAYKRDDYDGVVRSFSTKFEFANKAYSLLLGEWEGNYLDAAASVVYYVRNNSWLWSEVFRCPLDFSTFSFNGTTCSINAVDNSLAALIKAKKGTQYEYAVSGMKDEYPLKYDGLEMSMYVKWDFQGSDEAGMQYVDYAYNHDGGVNQRGQVPFYIMSSEYPFANRAEGFDGGTTVKDWGNNHQFTDEELEQYVIFRSHSEGETLFHLKADFHLRVSDPNNPDSTSNNTLLYVMAYRPGGQGAFWNKAISLPDGQLTVVEIDEDISLRRDDSLMMFFILGDDVRVFRREDEMEGDGMAIEATMRNSTQLIDVVKPVTLLNRLLKSMNGGHDGITGVISPGADDRLDNTFLLAAESIRGLDHAKLYSSYNKFCEWMSAEFGFVPVVDDGQKTVSFVHRDSLFVPLRDRWLGNDCTGFEYEVDSSLIYSRVRVGYDKQDYDSVNGRDEFRFTTEYTTGVTLTDNSLDLISPYRADAYGIEFLSAKRGEETTDDGSDTDVFMVGATREVETGGNVTVYADTYQPIRGGEYAVTGVLSPDTMFNAMYSQRFMVQSNAKYIGVSCSGLEYASSDGNSDVTVGGVSEKSGIQLPQRLFTAGKLSVTTGDLSIPESMDGSFDLEHNGKTYRGYLQDVSFNIGKGEGVKYGLIVWASHDS